MDLLRGGICPCRQCQRQCKIFASGVNFSIFTHFLCFFLLKLLKLGEIDGVKFLAWKSDGVNFLTNSMSAYTCYKLLSCSLMSHVNLLLLICSKCPPSHHQLHLRPIFGGRQPIDIFIVTDCHSIVTIVTNLSDLSLIVIDAHQWSPSLSASWPLLRWISYTVSNIIVLWSDQYRMYMYGTHTRWV